VISIQCLAPAVSMRIVEFPWPATLLVCSAGLQASDAAAAAATWQYITRRETHSQPMKSHLYVRVLHPRAHNFILDCGLGYRKHI